MQTLHPPCSPYNLHSNTQRRLKVAVMGLHKVGISTIIHHLENIYKIKHINQTHEKNNGRHEITIGRLVLDLVECHKEATSGLVAPEISDILSADIFILVFAVNRLDSFEYVEELKDLIMDKKGNDSAIVVVGNKHDVTERQVGFVYTDCVISMDWEMPYVEVSTKTGYNLRSILPNLFRHNYLKQYRNLFVNQSTIEAETRRKSAGFEKMWPIEIEALEMYNRTRAKSIAGDYSPLVAPKDTVKQIPKDKKQKKKSISDVNNFTFNMIFPCMDTRQQATPEIQIRSANQFIVVKENSPDKRRHSSCDKAGELERISELLSNRRCSVDVHGHLQRSGGWLKSLRRHLKV